MLLVSGPHFDSYFLNNSIPEIMDWIWQYCCFSNTHQVRVELPRKVSGDQLKLSFMSLSVPGVVARTLDVDSEDLQAKTQYCVILEKH